MRPQHKQIRLYLDYIRQSDFCVGTYPVWNSSISLVACFYMIYAMDKIFMYFTTILVILKRLRDRISFQIKYFQLATEVYEDVGNDNYFS